LSRYPQESAKLFKAMLPLLAILAALAYFQRWNFGSQAVAVALKMTPALIMAVYVVWRVKWAGWPMVFALVWHAMGDGCLEIGKAYFLVGVGAFFVGHFGYIASFWPHCQKWSELSIARKALVASVIVVMVGLNLFLWTKMQGALAVAAPVYAVALTTMTVMALLGKWSGPWVPVGALMFLFSDVLIGLRLFLGEETLAFLIWPTYVFAQMWIPFGWTQELLLKRERVLRP
jgi:uncharacterized membrane protein YhhN